MRIVEMHNGALLPTQTQEKQSGVGFDRLIAEVSARSQPIEPIVTETDSRNRGRNSNEDARGTRENRAENRESRSERRENRENRTQTDDPANTAATASVQNVAQEETDYATYEAVKTYEKQAVATIAEAMGLPIEKVTELLEQAEISVQDLNDPKAVTKLLKYALDAETPAELLTNAKFPELYKAVNEAVAKLAVSQATYSTLAESVENLEVTYTDGELIVSNETTDTPSLRAQVAQTTSTATSAYDKPQATEQALAEVTPAKAEEAPANDMQVANAAVSTETTIAKPEQTVKPAAQPIDTTDVIEQIMNQVKVTNVGGNFAEIRVTLRPESLGDIVLRVMTQNGIVTAQLEAENQRVKEALEASMNNLRDALEEQGIQFAELSVNVRQDDNERMNQFERARQESRHRMESIKSADAEAQPEVISLHNGVIDVTA